MLAIDRGTLGRTIAWLNQFRRLRVRYDKRADIHEAFVALGCALICRQSLRRMWRQPERTAFPSSHRQAAVLSQWRPLSRRGFRSRPGVHRPSGAAENLLR
jgi:hypothetical protein